MHPLSRVFSLPRLFVIAERSGRSDAFVLAQIEAALVAVPPGTVAVGLRDHAMPAALRVSFGRALRVATRLRGAPLIVFDRVDVALAIEADGVHLGRRSVGAAEARSLLPSGAWVSRSCHEESELEVAERELVDMATLGPIVSSEEKGPALSPERFAALKACFSSLRIFALGGVDEESAALAVAAGADGLAVIRAVLDASDAGQAARDLVEIATARART